MSFDATVTTDGDVLRISLAGELDSHECPAFAETMASGLSDDITSAAFDAAALRFIDSSGITELLRVQQVVAERGGSVVVSNAGGAVRRVLEISGLLDVLGVE